MPATGNPDPSCFALLDDAGAAEARSRLYTGHAGTLVCADAARLADFLQSLEQELAASLKELDALVVDVPMTPDQRTVFQELLNALTAAGSRLRDLITDYQAVQERLESLKLQHNDLEDEYTRLVEQQLGV